MGSKDNLLDLLEKLEMVQKNNTDYFLVTIEPGRNSDRTEAYYALKHEDSPFNLLEACFSLFYKMYDKEVLLDILVDYLGRIENDEFDYDEDEDIGIDAVEGQKPAKNKKKKKKDPPEDPPLV